MDNKISRRVLAVLIGVAIVSTMLSFFDRGNVTWGGLLQNFGTEMAGAVVTYWLLTKVLGTQEKKEELIAQMGSKVNDVAIAAVEALRRNGWLNDGSLRNGNFIHANLEGANLDGAELSSARFVLANLSKAHLGNAKLIGARLIETNLTGATLFNAHLERADLLGANLNGTILIGAHLEGTSFDNTNFEGIKIIKAHYNLETHWPDDFDPKAAGAILVDDEGNPINQD